MVKIRREFRRIGKRRRSVITVRDDNGKLLSYARVKKGFTVQQARQRYEKNKTLRENFYIQRFSKQANYYEQTQLYSSSIEAKDKKPIKRSSRARITQYIFEATIVFSNGKRQKLIARSKSYTGQTKTARKEAYNNLLGLIYHEVTGEGSDTLADETMINRYLDQSSVKEGIVEYIPTSV